MIELKAIVRDKPSGKERIRYMVLAEGSRTFTVKELNPKVKLNKKSVLDRIAHDYKVKKSEIKYEEWLFKHAGD